VPELHVDLFSWVALMTRTIVQMQSQLQAGQQSVDMLAGVIRHRAGDGEAPSAEGQGGDKAWAALETEGPTLAPSWRFARALLNAGEAAFARQAVDLHWSPLLNRFADVTGCAKDRYTPRYHTPFHGYVNLLPISSLTLDAPQRAEALQAVVAARADLSGGKGLQSLSNASREMLKQHDDYWTGPIWLNMNYMFLRALKRKYIALLGAEAQAVYDEVRGDLVANMGRVFKQTGKVWENYHWATGDGRGTAPFTGWSTTILLIASEQY
jgi:hypothetical protein